MMLFLSCTFLLLLSPIVLSLNIIENIVIIHNASDFIELANTLNRNVTRFEGSTIILDDDIDFTGYSGQFEPTGRNYYTLAAKFDGQGHTISNLHMNSSWRFVSIFGMINGTSFKNLVVDASCTIHSTHVYVGNSYTSYVGGIIGYIYPDRKDPNSIIENLVNMASVSFSGGIGPMNISDHPYTLAIGGVIAYCIPKKTDLTIRNCVNYGKITHEGSVAVSSLGGILSLFLDLENPESPGYVTIKNCANYGNLVHAGKTTGMLGFGGIVTIALKGIVERCMNFGIYISNQGTSAEGQIVGGGSEKLTIKDCTWTQNKNADVACGYSYGQKEVIIENSGLVTFNAKNLMDLNDWVESNINKDGSNNYSNWIALHLDGGSVGNASGTIVPAMAGFPVIDPTKEGHTFLHWCLDDGCSDGPATEEDILNETTTELYATWRINNYTATFYLNNKVYAVLVFKYNETIVSPDMTGVKKFHGWNLTYERMPGFDIIIVPNDPPEKEINAGAIAGGVIGGVAGVAIIVLIVLFIVLLKAKKEEKDMKMAKMNKMNKKKSANAPSRIVDDRERKRGFGIGVSISSEVEESSSEYHDLYPEKYLIPSISEALIQAGLNKDKAECAESDCMDVAKRAESEGALSPAFTLDDAAAVALYTYDFGPGYFEVNPYMLLNKALASGDSAGMQGVRGLLYVVMCALRKLPRYSGKTLYRGLRESIDRNAYVSGRVVAWRRLTSTSTDMKAVKSFLDSSMEYDKSTGTLFVINDGWGYNVQPYSLFPDDEEVLLELNRQFVVESVIESDVTIVNLRMLDTPLVLPEIFGDESK